ncbi:Uncharacterised protein [Mycobacteroides abscessus subsp. abscessus]|nr:Uncharacterised protein [Mycobacteroides abscessus]SHV06358.1 Uncharacterised protein [Mycobacteroides abscessus subsp. abscessus]SKL31834.1 Uncharacterised protein [Mycobacteroides abscessus subsp. abscessus]SKR97256.1 Uncharacterised protein [Mycobacteroides abscessus subsp. abscessus]
MPMLMRPPPSGNTQPYPGSASCLWWIRRSMSSMLESSRLAVISARIAIALYPLYSESMFIARLKGE